MAVRIKWDKYETALLIDTFWLIENQPLKRKEYIAKLSADLRKKAINAGLEIDDVFRNCNGISMQLAPIAHAFFPERATLSTSIIFDEMVKIYKNDYEMFQSILKEAKTLVGGDVMKDNKQSFSNWLKKKNYKKYPAKVVIDSIDIASEYCLDKHICKKNLWEIENPKEFMKIATKLSGMKLFRIIHKNAAMIFIATFPLMKEFLRETQSDNKPNDEVTTLRNRENPSDEGLLVSLEDEKNKFYIWLSEEQKLAKATCASYASAIKIADEFAKARLLKGSTLFSKDDAIVHKTLLDLVADEEFIKRNDKQHNRLFAVLRKYTEFRFENVINLEILQKPSKRRKQNSVDSIKYKYQEAVATVLVKHYLFGYRIESSIEMNRFRKYANIDEVELPETDDELKREILNAGVLIGDKVYVIGEDTVLELKSIFENNIAENKANVVFFETIMTCYTSVMEEHHITSDEMLREIVIENEDQIFGKYKNIYIAKNFVSTLGKCTEREAVTKEMKRVWGTTQTMQIAVLAEALPCIPERYIAQYLSANRNFVWASDGVYMSVDKLVITQEEVDAVYRFVLETCEKQGYVPLSDIPLGNMIEENYELSILSLLNAVYNKVLYDDFYLNGKILTKDNTGLDIVTLAKQFIEGKDECTFSEVNEKVSELSGTSYRYMAYEALYSTMVRIDEEHYVADKHVKFDVAAIDEILSKLIEDDFIAIKEISTFAVFPMCGQAWNHYLLESYCYRFSERFSLKVLGFNDKNAGMIITKGVTSDYEELLARAAARSKIELSPKNIGSFFFDVGYMGKRTFAALESVTERAVEIREG